MPPTAVSSPLSAKPRGETSARTCSSLPRAPRLHPCTVRVGSAAPSPEGNSRRCLGGAVPAAAFSVAERRWHLIGPILGQLADIGRMADSVVRVSRYLRPMRIRRPIVTLVVVAACGVLVPSASAGRGGGTSGIKVTVTPRVISDTDAITASFRAPYRLKKGHKWAFWLRSDCNRYEHPDRATGGWKFRKAVARGKRVTATFTPSSPGVVGMGSNERRPAEKWCSGPALVQALDHTVAKREASVRGGKTFKIHKTS